MGLSEIADSIKRFFRFRSDSAALIDREIGFQTLIESLGDGIIFSDREDRIILVNSRMASLSGYSVDEMRGRPSDELLLPKNERGALMERTNRRLRGISERYEILLMRKNGERFWAEINATPIYNSKDKIIGTLGAVTDITQRVEAVQELTFQKEFLRKVIDTTPSPIFAKDSNGVFTLANEALANLYDTTVDRIVGHHNREFSADPVQVERFLAEDLQVIAEAIPVVSPSVRTTNRRTKVEQWFHTIKVPFRAHNGGDVQVLAIATDITERKQIEESNAQLQAQLMQSQKMDAIGKLAAGVAHDLNNSLAAVTGHLNLLQSDPSLSADVAHSVDVALSGCARASSLIRQLLGFARQGRYAPHTLALADAVGESVEFLGRVVGDRFKLVIQCDSKVPAISADDAQLQQVLTNLIINATQAMPNGGQILLNIGTCIVGSNELFNAQAKSGRFVTLQVQDTGTGIAPEYLDKIFEPFFTTKSPSTRTPKGIEAGGSGLGLAMVYGIMQHHGGWAEVSSRVGVGSTFTLFFPQACQQQLEKLTDQIEIHGTGGTIMLIDDEPTLVDLGSQFITRAGHNVKGFTKCQDALRWFSEHKDEVELVILDMKMPDIDGPTCFAELRRIRPDIRVAILSGYVDDDIAQDLMAHGALKFFHKPLKYPELIAWIGDELGP